MAILDGDAGTAFDPRCVSAVRRIVSGGAPPGSGEPRRSPAALPAQAPVPASVWR
jgi:hypothetical protein